MKDTLSLLAQARAFLELEDKVQTRAMLDSLLILQPKYEQAWLLLAKVFKGLNEVSDWFYPWNLRSSVAIPPELLV